MCGNAGIDLGQVGAVFNAAQDVLASHPWLLHPIANATLPRDPNAADTLSNILDNIRPLTSVIRDPAFADEQELSSYQRRLLDEVLLPLIHRLETLGSSFHSHLPALASLSGPIAAS